VAPSGPISEKDKALQKVSLTKKEVTELQSVVMSLSWTTSTAPDFIYSVKESSRKVTKPSEYDKKQLRRVVSCMAGVVRRDEDGLVLGGPYTNLLLTTDTSYHGFDDLKSCTGGTIHLNEHTRSITSMCEKHKLTTDSAMAAEGVGSHLHTRKILPILYLLEELGLEVEHPAAFYMDKHKFMQTKARNKGMSNKSKHILVRVQVTKEALQSGKIEMKHLRSENMVADILTKALSPDKWNQLRVPLLGRSSIKLNDENDNPLVVSNLLVI